MQPDHTLRGTLSPKENKISLGKKPLSDDEIITLQHSLLSPGLQYITVQEMLSARTTLLKVMQSLNYYHAPAYLGLEHDNVPDMVTDTCAQLLAIGFIEDPTELCLETFFFESFDSDFLWIEETEALLGTTWYHIFKQTITHTHLNDIPVVLLCGQ